MKSLFLRLLVSMWVTMAILVGVFAMIHAAAFPKEGSAARRRFGARILELRADGALACVERGEENCQRRLAAMDTRDDRIAIYKNGELMMGVEVRGAAELDREARAAEDRVAFHTNGEDITAVVMGRDPSLTAIAIGPARSPWTFFIGPDTLPYRLGAIVAVTGIVSFLLARYLSKPLHVLRGAAQRMASGDLSVRVAGDLEGADGETQALGRDMDGMAERISDLLDAQRRLLRDVSHELRSPLARLAISLELVRRKSAPDVAPALDRIERETERLNAMIGELLTLSRLESDRGLEETSPVDLGALVASIAEDASVEAESRDVRVTTELASPTIAGNPELLRRAVENVVRNAVRFSEAGSSVDVSVHEDGERAEVRVRDHGPGVPDESLARIFEPFYRVETDRARTRGGTGIGLAITHRAVVLHGGSVEAKNAPGGGLEVRLALPINPGTSRTTPIPSSKRHPLPPG
jgi:two-component system sensor histidine kinase CpxA